MSNVRENFLKLKNEAVPFFEAELKTLTKHEQLYTLVNNNPILVKNSPLKDEEKVQIVVLANHMRRMQTGLEKIKGMLESDLQDEKKILDMQDQIKAVYFSTQEVIAELMEGVSPDFGKQLKKSINDAFKESMENEPSIPGVITTYSIDESTEESDKENWKKIKANTAVDELISNIKEDFEKLSKQNQSNDDKEIEKIEKDLQDYLRANADQLIDGQYKALQDQCVNYLKHLQNKIKANPNLNNDTRKQKMKDLQEMLLILQNKPVFSEDMLTKIKQFETKFNAVKSKFTTEKDKAFKQAVLHILASIVTLMLYPIVRALYASKHSHSFKFWQSHTQHFAASSQDNLNAITSHIAKKPAR